MTASPSSAHSSIVADVLGYLEQNFAEPISLRDVAKTLGYSPAYLTETFRHATGTPITAWIIKRRVRAAQQLLCRDALPVAEACYAVGFNDRSYFARQFAKYVGVSPSEYRERCGRANGAAR